MSHNFDMGDWRPDTVARVEWPAGTTSSVYAWVLPADIAGNWELTVSSSGGDRHYRVRFTQQYQEVSGTASSSGRRVSLSGARLRGDRIEFRLREQGANPASELWFRGQISATTMAGVVRGAESGATRWQAARR